MRESVYLTLNTLSLSLSLSLSVDLDQYVANHPFTGIGETVRGAQFAGTIDSWLLAEPS